MSRSNFSSESDKILLKIEPSKSSILPYVFGIIFGIILIVLTITFDIRFNTLNYYLVLMAILLYLIMDYNYRQRSNIRLIELDEKSLNIYKGKKMLKENIQLSKITEVKSKKRFLSVIITLKLETPGRKKDSIYNISSDQILNADLITLYEDIKRLRGNN